MTSEQFLLMMSDNFINTDSHTHKTINDFKNIFYENIIGQNKNTKKILAKKFSTFSHTPRVIALYFSMQDILIAEPILRFATSLTENDMKIIAEKNPPIFAKVLITRKDISPWLKDFHIIFC